MSEYAHQISGIDIHPYCKIGVPFSIDHGSCVVIGESSIIGNKVRLYHNVTLGAKSLSNPDLLVNKKRHPTIKDNVIIYSNVTILGGKTIIGNNVIIGSGITLFDSVKDNTTLYLKDNKIVYRKRN
jgi:serine O-acetyltransferase